MGAGSEDDALVSSDGEPQLARENKTTTNSHLIRSRLAGHLGDSKAAINPRLIPALASRRIARSELSQELFAGGAALTHVVHGGLETGEGIGCALSSALVPGFEFIDGGARFEGRLVRPQHRFVHGNARFMDRQHAR